MEKQQLLNTLKGSLIVSCQALEDEPLYSIEGGIMPLMAKAAMDAGAKAIRANSVRDIVQIKQYIPLPVIGLIKKQYPPCSPYITATMKEVDELVAIHTDIIAIDATNRKRIDGLTSSEFIKAIKNKYPNQLFMADIATFEEGKAAYEAGVDFVGTTLFGYTEQTCPMDGPNYTLIQQLSESLPIPIIAEGKVHYPQQAKEVLAAGAYCVVVGGAITRPQEITSRFVKAIQD